MSRIRIMHVITQLDVGGAERQLLTLCGQLPPARFDNLVVSLVRGGSMVPEFEAAGATVVGIDRRDRGGPVGQMLALVHLIRTRRPDVLQTWLQKANHVGRLAGWLAGQGAIVANFRDMGFMASAGDTLLDRLLDSATALTLHNSRTGRRAYLARVHGAAAVRHGILPNGIDCDRFRPDEGVRSRLRGEIGVADDARVAIMVARLHPIKDPQLFLSVARLVRARMPEAIFWLVGGGPLEAELREMLEREPDPGIWISGERDDIPHLLQAADLALLTSSSEGLSNTILEAMSCGLPVVASAVGGNCELVEDGLSGYLFSDREPERVAELVKQLLQSATLGRTMGGAGRERALESFSLAGLARNAASRLDRLVRE